jgi:hypothetical protein
MFSASPKLVEFGGGNYRRRSEQTRRLLGQLTPQEQREALERLSPEHRREVMRSLPVEELLGALSPEQIHKYLDRMTASRPEQSRKSRRKK